MGGWGGKENSIRDFISWMPPRQRIIIHLGKSDPAKIRLVKDIWKGAIRRQKESEL